MRIKDIPWFNRPGYRLKKGRELNDAEILSIVLWIGKKGENAIDMAQRLLKKYNFHGLNDLSLTELKKEVGEVKALKIKAMFEIFKKTSKLQRKGFKPTIESAKDVYNYFVDELKDKKKEYFYALLLDSKNRIIKEELISVGTLDETIIHPREVFNVAIRNNAKNILLIHNHPSQTCHPSEADKLISKRMFKTGEIVGIEVVDHLIIAKESYYSTKADKTYNFRSSE